MAPRRRRGPETRYVKNITENELKTILAWLRKRNYKVYLVACLMALGLRVGEAVRLHIYNFNHDFTKLTYSLEKSGRLHTRLVPNWLAEKIRQHVNRLPKNKDRFLFLARSKKTRHIGTGNVHEYFRKARTALGLDQIYHVVKLANGKQKPLYRVSPHTFRHFAVDQLYDTLGFDLKATADIIGHRGPETTTRYYLSNRAYREKEALHVFERLDTRPRTRRLPEKSKEALQARAARAKRYLLQTS